MEPFHWNGVGVWWPTSGLGCGRQNRKRLQWRASAVTACHQSHLAYSLDTPLGHVALPIFVRSIVDGWLAPSHRVFPHLAHLLFYSLVTSVPSDAVSCPCFCLADIALSFVPSPNVDRLSSCCSFTSIVPSMFVCLLIRQFVCLTHVFVFC